MITTERLTELIEVLAEAEGMERRTMARHLTGSGDTIDRWSAGTGLTLRRAERILQNISNRWPSGRRWPRDVKRPAREKFSKRAPALNTQRSIEKEGQQT